MAKQVRKPDSDLVGKLYRKVDGSEVHYDRDCYWEGHGYFIEVSATPSGGGEWTVEFLKKLVTGSIDYDEEMQRIAAAHNATLQPRDCGELSEGVLNVGGKVVRDVWIKWAKEQPNPKPSWLVPWEKLSEPEKEVDRRIFSACVQRPVQFKPDCGEDTKLLGELLAMIHGDGGHYQSDRGTEKAVKDAVKIVCNLRVEIDAAREDTKRLDWLEDWLEKVKWDDYATIREAIDAAMSETRRGEKSQTWKFC